MKQREKRILSGALCALFLAILLCFGLFVMANVVHECPGQFCPVCALLCSGRQLLRVLPAAAWLLGGASLLLRGGVLPLRANGAPVRSLVSLKVKLSN